MAPRRDHTRENQERPLATPVVDPEKVIRRVRDLQRKTCRAARTSRSDLFVEGD